MENQFETRSLRLETEKTPVNTESVVTAAAPDLKPTGGPAVQVRERGSCLNRLTGNYTISYWKLRTGFLLLFSNIDFSGSRWPARPLSAGGPGGSHTQSGAQGDIPRDPPGGSERRPNDRPGNRPAAGGGTNDGSRPRPGGVPGMGSKASFSLLIILLATDRHATMSVPISLVKSAFTLISNFCPLSLLISHGN